MAKTVVNKTVEQIEFDTNVKMFGKHTDMAVKSVNRLQRILAKSGKTGKLFGETSAKTIVNLRKLKERLKDITELRKEDIQILSPEEVDRFKGQIDDIKKQFGSISKEAVEKGDFGDLKEKMGHGGGPKENLDPKGIEGLNKLLEDQEDILQKITKRINISKKAEETKGDLLKKSKKAIKSKYDAEIAANKLVSSQLHGQVTGWEEIKMKLGLVVKNAALYNSRIIETNRAMKLLEKGIKGVGAAIKAAFLPLLAIFAIGELITKIFDTDKAARELDKSMLDLANSSNHFFKSLKDQEVQRLSAATIKLATNWNVTVEQFKEYESTLVEAGFQQDKFMQKLNATGDAAKKTDKEVHYAIEDFAALSTISGMTMQEIATGFGEVRESLGEDLESLSKSMTALKGKLEGTGINFNRFYAGVTNAASGMGLFGTKIIDVERLFVSLTKKLQVPPKEAMEMATKMAKSFDEMDISMQMLTLSGTDYAKNMDALTDKARAQGDKLSDDMVRQIATANGEIERVGKEGSDEWKKYKDDLIETLHYRDATLRLARQGPPAKKLALVMESGVRKALGGDFKDTQDVLNKIHGTSLLQNEAFKDMFADLDPAEQQAMFKMFVGELKKGKKMPEIMEDLANVQMKQAKDLQMKQNREAAQRVQDQAKSLIDSISQGLDKWFMKNKDTILAFADTLKEIAGYLGQLVQHPIKTLFGMNKPPAEHVSTRTMHGKDLKVGKAIELSELKDISEKYAKAIRDRDTDAIPALEKQLETLGTGLKDAGATPDEITNNINVNINGGNPAQVKQIVMNLLYQKDAAKKK